MNLRSFEHRRGQGLTALAAAVLALFLLAGCGSTPQPPAASGTNGTYRTTPPAARTTGSAPKPTQPQLTGAQGKVRVQDTSLIATARSGNVTAYATAGASQKIKTLANPLASGAPLTFLVQERQGDWLRVLLPIRPNEIQGWVKASDVKISQTSYRITVSTGKHQLTLYRAGKVALQRPVGLGAGTTPTPGGVYFLKELLRPPNPSGSYGPYAYGLSGYSNVLDEFLGGDGEIGIHGTDDPSSVGKNVSHGCIRMTNADITKLAKMLPLGVPVQIIA